MNSEWPGGGVAGKASVDGGCGGGRRPVSRWCGGSGVGKFAGRLGRVGNLTADQVQARPLRRPISILRPVYQIRVPLQVSILRLQVPKTYQRILISIPA
jgi:hypothetical protein